jgi:hypothetical protein
MSFGYAFEKRLALGARVINFFMHMAGRDTFFAYVHSIAWVL